MYPCFFVPPTLFSPEHANHLAKGMTASTELLHLFLHLYIRPAVRGPARSRIRECQKVHLDQLKRHAKSHANSPDDVVRGSSIRQREHEPLGVRIVHVRHPPARTAQETGKTCEISINGYAFISCRTSHYPYGTPYRFACPYKRT